MNRVLTALVALMAWILVPSTLRAQSNSTESPYSRFGVGELSQKTVNISRGMGNVGIALRSSRFVNPKNPASYAAVDSQTFIFDFAASAGASWFVEGSNKDTRLLGNFEYATLLFPVAKWMSISAGLMPYSTVGYRYGTSQPIEGISDREYATRYQGKGNISEAYFGVAFDPIRNFSLGVNAGYLFGTLGYSRTVDFGASSAYNPTTLESLSLQGIKLDAGIQYSLALKGDQALLLGATYAPSFALKSTFIHKELLASGSSTSGTTPRQEISDVSSTDYRTPHSFGLGLGYQWGDKLLLATDIQYNMWEKALPNKASYRAQNQWQVGLGATYTPNQVARSLWQRMEYRFGLSAENSYITFPLDATTYTGYTKGGISLGLGIPMIDRRSWVDLTFDYSHLFPQQATSVHENYFRLTLGLRFNEAWFRKIKLD
ncbi:MAG: hypothetical protein PUI84_01410 [Bacteroidales bacterium]|nr:hypothetical protein [Porphyromonas sp.]MDD6933967.1 hypothetical protein [Bacteroidales bacterium]MDY3101973.1 hypothetical protein [Porphyromonas sp.]